MDFYTAALLQGLGYSAMGLGIFISLRIFNIPDITTDGSFTLGGVVTAVMLSGGHHPGMVLAFALLSGALAGIATGFIHTRLRVNPLLSGILVMTALYSVNLSIMGRSNLPLTDVQSLFGLSVWPGERNATWIIFVLFTAILVAALTWLLKTDFGITMRATGDNEQMVRSMGVDTSRMKVTGLALANALTALSGYLLVQYQGFADINMGIGIVISGLAAVMLGDALSKLTRSPGIFMQILMIVAGSVLFREVLAVALTLGLNPNYLKLVTAVIVLGILAVTRLKKSVA